MFCVAIFAGTENHPGWNCAGPYELRREAEQCQDKLNAQGFRTIIVAREPWCGTIAL